MLTPIEIQNRSLKTGMGYNKADVDTFFTEISADYANLYKENLAIKEEITRLKANLEHYKEIEKSLQKALVLAQTTAEETIVGAKKNAAVIEQEAVLKAQSIIADAKVELDRIRIQTVEMLQEYEKYKSRYKALALSQIEMLDSEAFNMSRVAGTQLENLHQMATENMENVQSKPVFSASDVHADVEEDFDETLETDEAIIKDFSSIFDSEDK